MTKTNTTMIIDNKTKQHNLIIKTTTFISMSRIPETKQILRMNWFLVLTVCVVMIKNFGELFRWIFVKAGVLLKNIHVAFSPLFRHDENTDGSLYSNKRIKIRRQKTPSRRYIQFDKVLSRSLHYGKRARHGRWIIVTWRCNSATTSNGLTP